MFWENALRPKAPCVAFSCGAPLRLLGEGAKGEKMQGRSRAQGPESAGTRDGEKERIFVTTGRTVSRLDPMICPMISGSYALLATVLTFVMCSPAVGADWPGWRGPRRDGHVEDFKAPAAWPKMLQCSWKAQVGEGHSSPVVSGSKVYQFVRQGDKEVVICLDLATGKEAWRSGYAAPYEPNQYAKSHGKGPKSTPAVGGGKVYTLGISGILSAFDAATGGIQWQKEFSKEFPATSPLYGTASSPLADGPLGADLHEGGGQRVRAHREVQGGGDSHLGASRLRGGRRADQGRGGPGDDDEDVKM